MFRVSVLAFIGMMILLLSVSLFLRTALLRLSLMSFSVFILLVELLLFLGVKTKVLSTHRFQPVTDFYFDKLPVFSESSVSFDSVLGYRWNRDSVTVRKFAMETMVFENTFKGNNFGQHSSREYFQRKSSNHVKRWIIFGDSFTDAYFLKRGWVDVLDSLYKASEDSVELYSFSVNGGGIKNWYQIFTRFLESDFEYDGVVFAVFGNDLARDFFVMHQDSGKTLSQYYGTPPDMDMVKMDLNENKRIINENNIHSEVDSRWYVSRTLNYVYRTCLEIKYYRSLKNSTQDLREQFIQPADLRLDDKYFIKKYGDKYYLFAQMLLSLKHSHKSVAAISIPDEYGLSLNRASKTTSVQQELSWISKEFGLTYIDGYHLLLKYTSDNVEAFIPLDGHWNQHTSDSFAKAIYKDYNTFFR